MKLTIDAEVVDLPYSSAMSFHEYCKNLMEWLLERNRSISMCKIDGVVLHTLEDANQLFPAAKNFEVESVSLTVALQSAVALHSAQLRRLEGDCENLVTDCLLAEPEQIAKQWENLCMAIKEELNFLPRLGHFLSEEQIDRLINNHYQDLNNLMKEVSEVLPKADVVAFSDILEMKLLPWIRSMREFSLAVLKLVDAMESKKS